MAENIDSLSISISASTQKASDNIDTLTKSLDNLATTLSKNIDTSRLDRLGDALNKIATASKELGKATKTADDLPKLTQNLKNLIGSLASCPEVSDNVTKLVESLGNLSKIDLKSVKENMRESADVSDVSESSGSIPDSGIDLTKIEKTSMSFSNLGERISTATKFALEFGKSLGSWGSKGIKGINAIANGLSKIKNRLSQVGKENKKTFNKGFKFVLKYVIGVRSLYALWNKVRNGIEQGNKNLARYDANFNNSISKMKSAMGTLQNAMAVAFAPVINAIADKVVGLINLFTKAFNTIARFFATLTGAKKVVQATGYFQDYAKSLDSASKSAKQLAIDELNLIDSTTGSTGSNTVDVNDMFETLDTTNEFSDIVSKIKDAWRKADFTDVGKTIGTGIINGLNKIDWKKIQTTSGNIGKSVATFINGAISSEVDGQSFGWTIGNTVGNAIQTGLHLAHEFVVNFDWFEYGNAIGEGVEGCLDGIDWAEAGETFSRFVSGFIEALTGFFDDSERWEKFGKDIATFIKEIDWKLIITDLGNLGVAILDAINISLTSALMKLFGTDDKTIDAMNDYRIKNNGKLPGINMYASGGVPDTGSLFIAGESGAEIVANSSKGTEVMNQGQIKDAISVGVRNAMSDMIPYLSSIANSTRQTADKDWTLDGRSIFKSTQNYATDYRKRTGQSAF